MEQTVLDPVGVELSGLSLRDLDPGAVDHIRELLAEHGVVVLREQHLDDETFVSFLRRFGELTFTAGETPVEGAPDLNVISNVGRATPPRSTFHTDTSYVRRPPTLTALRAVAIPEQGGATQFTNQYRAFDTLPPQVRDRLDGRTIRHVVTGVDPGEGEEVAAEHPVFRTHPVSGRTALFLTTPKRCAAVSGMDQADAEETIGYLYAHSTAEDNTLRHAWAPGDVVIWDNACVLHRADHDGVVGDRVLHRGMVGAAEQERAASGQAYLLPAPGAK